jgi:hypothetical protein
MRDGAMFAKSACSHPKRQKVASDTRINAAIRECLDTFEPGRSPIAHLAAYVERLRNDQSWTERDIREVELAVRRIFAKMTGSDTV